MPRQIERRQRFLDAFSVMPAFTVWQEERIVFDSDGNEMTKMIGNFQKIPRKIQREMARARSKREYRVAHGLPV